MPARGYGLCPGCEGFVPGHSPVSHAIVPSVAEEVMLIPVSLDVTTSRTAKAS